MNKYRRRRSATRVLMASAVLLAAHTVRAEVTTTWGSWAQLVAEGDLGFADERLADVRLWLELQGRWNEDWQHFYQGVIRAAVGYSLSDRATLWVGYNFVPTQLAGKPYFAQQDVFPGFRYLLPTEFGTFMFRTMVDINFIRGDDVRYKPRQLIRFLHPFAFEERLSLVVWDEVFVRLNSTEWGGPAGFDQNRAFVGFGWTFSPEVRAELGYMNQYVEDRDLLNETDNNLIMGSLFFAW